MRWWTGMLIVLFAGCGSSPRAEPAPKPEQVAYAKAAAERTPEACRAYRRRFPRGAHRKTVDALYKRLRRESFETASHAGTDAAYDAHIRRFPESEAYVRSEQRKHKLAQESAARNLAKYEAVLAARTAKACYAYLRQRDQDYRREVRALLAELMDKGFAAAKKKGTPEAYAEHLKMFPTDRKRVAAFRRELREEQLRVVGEAKSVRFVFEYTERDEPAEFPPDLAGVMRDLVGYAGLRIVDDDSAELVIRIAGNGFTSERKYSRGYVLVDAYSKFRGEFTVRHRSGYEDRSLLTGSFTVSSNHMSVPAKSPRRMRGGAKPSEAIHHARTLVPLVEFVHRAFGPAPVAKALAHPFAPLNEAAAESLRDAKSGPKEARIEAVRPYLGHADIQTRRRAVYALERIWRPASEAPEDERLSFYLFMSWRRPDPLPVRGLTRASIPMARAVLAKRAYRFGIESRPPMHRVIEDLQGESLPPERAAMLLASLGDAKGLIAELKRRSTPIAVCWALARVGGPARSALLSILDDASSPGRMEAYWTLALMGEQGILERLAGEPASFEKTKVRVRDQLRLAALLETLAGSERAQREEAARLLIGIRDPSVFQPLLAALNDESVKVYERALLAIGILADRRALVELRKVPARHRGKRLKGAIARIEAYSPD